MEIVAKMGPNYTPRVQFSHRWHLLFAKEIDGYGAFDANNPIKLELFDIFGYSENGYSIPGFAEVSGDISYYSGFGSLNFKTKEEMLNFLSTYGLSPTNAPKADTLKVLTKREIEEARQWQENVDKYYRTPEQRNSLKQERNRRLGFDLDSVLIKKKAEKKLNQHKRGGSDPNLFLTVDNIRFTENTGSRFLEFDVMGRADTVLIMN